MFTDASSATQDAVNRTPGYGHNSKEVSGISQIDRSNEKRRDRLEALVRQTLGQVSFSNCY